MYFILDACVLINIIHIDDGEILMKKILNLKPHISDVVFDEIRKNVYKLYEKKIIELTKHKDNEIQVKLSYLRNIQYSTTTILEYSENFIEDIKKYTNYHKENGELYSIALSSFISKMENSKIIFVTDDYPAKDTFSNFLFYNKIGYIEDSVDLLLFIYSIHNDITNDKLDFFLSNLSSQYSYLISNQEKKLKLFQSNLPMEWIKDNYIKQKISECILAIENFDYPNLKNIHTEISRKKKYDKLTSLLEEGEQLYELGGKKEETNLFLKVKSIREELKRRNIFRLSI